LNCLECRCAASEFFGGKARAFNTGYAQTRGSRHDIVGNLDADITFETRLLRVSSAKV